ncbi:MAG: hypothetical protein QG652_1774 [Pseudomonadota bacterium]|nr:hypothetical protein [Pseudomonadota bacterium]
MTRTASAALLCLSLLAAPAVQAGESPELNQDPHYSDMGFFDIHLCNWPDRVPFFKILFSSAQFQHIDSMTVYTPNKQLLASLDKSKFRVLQKENKPEKRVYMLDLDVPEQASTGWYSIDVKTAGGAQYQARDYVIMTRLEKVSVMQPAAGAGPQQLPVTLTWQPVPGAQYYQVFVRDEWSGDMVFSSELLNTAELKIPEDKLEAGGYYSWSVHARDTNEHVLLGVFHMGSMSTKAFFSVAD